MKPAAGLRTLDYAYIAAELGKKPDGLPKHEMFRRLTRATWKSLERVGKRRAQKECGLEAPA